MGLNTKECFWSLFSAFGPLGGYLCLYSSSNSTLLLYKWVAREGCSDFLLHLQSQAEPYSQTPQWYSSLSNISSPPKTKLWLLHSVTSCVKTGFLVSSPGQWICFFFVSHRFLNSHQCWRLVSNCGASLNYEHPGHKKFIFLSLYTWERTSVWVRQFL